MISSNDIQKSIMWKTGADEPRISISKTKIAIVFTLGNAFHSVTSVIMYRQRVGNGSSLWIHQKYPLIDL